MKSVKFKRRIALGVLGCILGATGAVSFGFEDDDSFNTKEMIDATAKNITSCTDYCIVAMEIRVYWTLTGPKYYRTLVVEHNMPDMLVMTAPEEEKMPWDLYRNTFSKAVSSVANSIASSTLGFEMGGGNSSSTGFGATQSLVFKETDVIGNPSVFMYELLGSRIPNSGMFNGGGGGGLQDKPNLKPSDQRDFNSFIDGMKNGFGNLSLGLIQAMGGAAIKAYSHVQPQAQVWNYQTRSFVNTFKMGAKISRYGCDAKIQPLNPYYNSMFDAVQWRAGYPITDPHKSGDILNPLKNDWLKPTNSFINSGALGVIPSGWGKIYPRTGFVNNPDDYQVATITAIRGVSIVSESGGPRVSKYAGSGLGKVMWQQTHPTVSKCHYNATNTIDGASDNKARNYAWNGWRRTKCSLRTVGVSVMQIPVGPICMRNILGTGGVEN